MNPAMHPAFVTPAEMLRVPKAADLPPAKRDGARCVWCGRGASMDLGPRISVIDGSLQRWHPRSCRPCARREAARVHGIHQRTCARCTHRDYCPDSRALYALSLAREG